MSKGYSKVRGVITILINDKGEVEDVVSVELICKQFYTAIFKSNVQITAPPYRSGQVPPAVLLSEVRTVLVLSQTSDNKALGKDGKN